MESIKLKMKIGGHEFEAEGPPEIVQAQLSAFREMVASAPPPHTTLDGGTMQYDEVEARTERNGTPRLDSIMKAEGRIVSLTAGADSTEDAARLILLGQKVFRNNETVTGAEIVDGLKVSGQAVARLDRLMEKIAAEGHAIVIGSHRAKRYRLTNQGFNRAQEIARSLIATVA
jgi:hypothetical protein